MSSIDDAIIQLKNSLDPAARREFGDLEQTMLRLAMEQCRLTALPELVGPRGGCYASCDMVCEICGEQYASHPMDWRLIGYGDVPFLNVLCDGRRVKL